jgi:proline dehydrogenase
LPCPKLDFNDYSAVFKTRSTTQLLRAYAVLKACSYPGLVKHADKLLATSRRLLGDSITFGIVRQTFFKHFCAGMCQPPRQHRQHQACMHAQ